MSGKSRLRTLSLGIALGFGSVLGMPMRAEEIEELMSQANQPKIAYVLPVEADDDEEK
jgi:hypothetical protein